jgi:solute carrier family 10 (sodium/bile acid cotransporter), member 7
MIGSLAVCVDRAAKFLSRWITTHQIFESPSRLFVGGVWKEIPLKKWLHANWFLIALGCVLFLGFAGSDSLMWLTRQTWLRDGVIASVMFTMALTLSPGSISESLRKPVGALLGCAMNFGLLPFVGWIASRGMEPSMSMGLVVAVAAPCTLASAAVWTRKAGGNFATAILVTMITNLFCFLLTPLWVQLLTTGEWSIEQASAAQSNDQISLLSMIKMLALLVVLPMVLGQVLHRRSRLGSWAMKRRTPLNVAAQSGILFIVLLGTIKNAQDVAASPSTVNTWLNLLHLIVAVNVVHMSVFACGWYLSAAIGLKRPEQIAVAIAGSQKTLMVGLAIAQSLNVSILPALTYHISQLIVDTLLAQKIAKNSRITESGEAIPSPGASNSQLSSQGSEETDSCESTENPL